MLIRPGWGWRMLSARYGRSWRQAIKEGRAVTGRVPGRSGGAGIRGRFHPDRRRQGGFQLSVLSFGAKRENPSAATHRVKVTLTPADREGQDMLIGDTGPRDTGPRVSQRTLRGRRGPRWGWRSAGWCARRCRWATARDDYRLGSGYLIADGLVLTAAHVLERRKARRSAGRPGAPRWPVPGGDWEQATVAWADARRDVAVLACPALRAEGRVRWGRLAGPDPLDWGAVGFPAASATRRGRAAG